MGVPDAKTFSIGLETGFALPVTPDHPLETLPSSKFTWTPNRIQGEGMRVNGSFPRSGRRVEVSGSGAGNLDVELLSKGQGLLWKLLLGSATTTLVAGSTYQNVFTRPTSGVLPSATIQKAIQLVDGTVKPETYSGATCSDWELSFDNNALVKLSANFDARDISTATTAVSTTLSSSASIGATTVSTAASVPAGAMVNLNGIEARLVTAVSGAGPYTLTLNDPLDTAYSSGVAVTVVGYSAPSYPSGGTLYSFAGLSIYNGTLTLATTTALASATTPLNGLLRSGAISVNNTILAERYLAGSAGRKAQQRLGAPVGTVKLGVEYIDTTMRDMYLNDTPTTLLANFTGGPLSTGLETVQVALAEIKPNQDMPDADGSDVSQLDMEFAILDNLTAAQPIQVVQRTSDTAL